jgi:hypothetical protein
MEMVPFDIERFQKGIWPLGSLIHADATQYIAQAQITNIARQHTIIGVTRQGGSYFDGGIANFKIALECRRNGNGTEGIIQVKINSYILSSNTSYGVPVLLGRKMNTYSADGVLCQLHIE